MSPSPTLHFLMENNATENLKHNFFISNSWLIHSVNSEKKEMLVDSWLILEISLFALTVANHEAPELWHSGST